MTAQHHKRSDKHVGFEAKTQSLLNNVTSFYSDLERGPHGIMSALVRGGTLDMQSSGDALVSQTADTQKVVGCSPLADGQIWHEMEGGWPANQDQKQQPFT